MPSLRTTPLSSHRERMRKKGMVRVEIQARKDDVSLLRRIAGALADPVRETEARRFLLDHFDDPQPGGLKVLLAAAPLDGIDLERSRDTGRSVDL